MKIMRSLDRLSGSDQDCGDREMYIDLDDASVDSLTGKRSRHHVVGAEVSMCHLSYYYVMRNLFYTIFPPVTSLLCLTFAHFLMFHSLDGTIMEKKFLHFSISKEFGKVEFCNF